jgi:hypothetical protein
MWSLPVVGSDSWQDLASIWKKAELSWWGADENAFYKVSALISSLCNPWSEKSTLSPCNRWINDLVSLNNMQMSKQACIGAEVVVKVMGVDSWVMLWWEQKRGWWSGANLECFQSSEVFEHMRIFRGKREHFADIFEPVLYSFYKLQVY